MKYLFFIFALSLFQMVHANSLVIVDVNGFVPKDGIPCELDGYQLAASYGTIKDSETTISVLFKSSSPDTVDAYLVLNNEVKFKFSSFPQCNMEGFLDYLWVSEDSKEYSVEWRVLTTGSGTGEPFCNSIFTKQGSHIRSKGESDYNNHDYYCKFVSGESEAAK